MWRYRYTAVYPAHTTQLDPEHHKPEDRKMATITVTTPTGCTPLYERISQVQAQLIEADRADDAKRFGKRAMTIHGDGSYDELENLIRGYLPDFA